VSVKLIQYFVLLFSQHLPILFLHIMFSFLLYLLLFLLLLKHVFFLKTVHLGLEQVIVYIWDIIIDIRKWKVLFLA